MKMKLERIYFCTGARNHDLLALFDKDKLSFEFDERVASFKALGLSKVSSDPVSVCTTSGTAVAECVPAMVEALYSGQPLVLISGDRPKKLHGTGAPQTIDHEVLTRGARKTYLEVPLEDLKELSLEGLEFPIHVNVLVDDTSRHDLATLIHQDISAFKSFVSQVKKPLFLFSHEKDSMRPFITKFKDTKLMFYAETLSGGRDLSELRTEKKLVKLFNAGFFDSIIRIGHTPLSKVWRLLEKKPIPVFSFDNRSLAGLSFGDILPWGSADLLHRSEFWETLEALSPYPVADETSWLLHDLIEKYPHSEISFFHQLNQNLNENEIVYLGNSLVIRFFELTQKKNIRSFGNRGVNGIDGQLASAIGLTHGTNETVYCILGDVTAFYDLSSMRDIPENLKIIIMNNGGGRIFDMLNLDRRIVLEHSDNFEELSRAMKLSYSRDLSDFKKVQVLELFPEQQQTQLFLKEWNK